MLLSSICRWSEISRLNAHALKLTLRTSHPLLQVPGSQVAGPLAGSVTLEAGQLRQLNQISGQSMPNLQITASQVVDLKQALESANISVVVATVSAGSISGALTGATIDASKVTGQVDPASQLKCGALPVCNTVTSAQVTDFGPATASVVSALTLDATKVSGSLSSATVPASQVTGQIPVSQLSGQVDPTTQLKCGALPVCNTVTSAQVSDFTTAVTNIVGTLGASATLNATKVSGSLSSATLPASQITGQVDPASQLKCGALPVCNTVTSAQVTDFATAVTNIVGTLAVAPATINATTVSGALSNATLPASQIAGQVDPASQLKCGALPVCNTVTAAQVTDFSSATASAVSALTLDATKVSGSLSQAKISPANVCTTGQAATALGSCARVCLSCVCKQCEAIMQRQCSLPLARRPFLIAYGTHAACKPTPSSYRSPS